MTDSELVRRARQGDRRAFDELILRHQSLSQSLATRIVGDRERGLELNQEAFLQAYLSLDQLRNPASFRSWLCGIVVNLCKNDLRRPKIEQLSVESISGGHSFDSLPFAAVEPGPAEVVEAREAHRLVLDAISELSAANQKAVLLYYFEELSVREIASLLHISVSAVKGRLHKSRRQLRSTLAEPKQQSLADETRRRQMIPVAVIDIVIPNPENQHRVMVLLDEDGRRILPIWIGAYEATAIALHLQGTEVSRPMTYSFMAGLLAKAGVQVESVSVSALINDTFYATVRGHVHEDTFEVDARPSDAIALALCTRIPIFVAEEVMEAAGAAIPAAVEMVTQGKGLSEVLKQDGPQREKEAQGKSSQERQQEAREELLAYVFGAAT